ncbi:pyridoxamine 5'-phosphate oxidase family protein [Salinirarus marinus]|uniref:pyridoxamine 5'-phosphate oxidase family protein n=1 Tax=Salinirarus marinus TaxID=3068310 RepID=UPI003C6CB392
METEYGTEMADAEAEAYLREQGHGVLSLSRDGVAYGIPISFGYDPDERRCVLQFVSAPESDKEAFVAETTTATLTVYDWESPDEWRSVVVSGPIEPIRDADLVEAADVFAETGAAIGLTVFGRSLAELATNWYQLRIAEASARKAPALG